MHEPVMRVPSMQPNTRLETARLSGGSRVPGTVEKRLSFEYGRSVVAIRVFFLVVLLVIIAVSVALSPSFSPIYTAALGAVFAGYFVVFALSPLLVQHWVTRSRIILRQGWYFRAVIPFADIESVQPADEAGRRPPLGIVRPFGQQTLFVTGGRMNLVSLRLRAPRRFWQSFGLYSGEIVFDVVDRPRFLAALEERRLLLPPVEADGPDADLGD